MFREREFKKLNSCLCSTAPKVKSTIKQFIQIEHKQPLNKANSNRLRHSRLLTNMPQQNHVTCIKYPLNNQPTTYQPFPVHQPENLYDEIDPVDEDLTTAYDHLSHPYMPQVKQGYRAHVNIEVRDVRPQFTQTSVVPPPPPPIQRVPKISRRQFFNKSFNKPFNNNMASPSISSLKKSLNSTINLSDGNPISERSYLFEKWATDNSSGYNSSQDLSNNTGSSNSSIISYCSINEPVKTKFTAASDTSNLVDSGFSTLNIDNEGSYNATENLSNYSNVSPSSNSSFNSSYHESVHDLHPITPFPRIQTSMVAQIKKVNQQTPSKPFNANSSSDNRSIAKSYSVNDVLFSMKKMGISNTIKQTIVTKPKQNQHLSQLEFSPIYNKIHGKSSVIPVHFQTSTPPERYSSQYQRDLEDYLCDEEVESILSPKKLSVESKPLNTHTSFSNLYKYNNRNVAIWEQLV